jgi:hypothetical protein
MDLWIYGFMDLWIYGFMDLWIYGFMDLWIYGFMDLWIYGFMDCGENYGGKHKSSLWASQYAALGLRVGTLIAAFERHTNALTTRRRDSEGNSQCLVYQPELLTANVVLSTTNPSELPLLADQEQARLPFLRWPSRCFASMSQSFLRLLASSSEGASPVTPANQLGVRPKGPSIMFSEWLNSWQKMRGLSLSRSVTAEPLTERPIGPEIKNCTARF